MAYWSCSRVFSRAWLTMDGSWGTMGNYNITLSYVGANEYTESQNTSKLRLLISSSQSGTYQTVADVTANSTTLAKAEFNFDVSKFVTPASLQKVYCRMQWLGSDGSVLRTSNFVNNTIKAVLGDDYATLAYAKSNEPPSTFTFTTSSSNYQDFTKPLKMTWNAVTQTGSFAPHHYKIWIRFSYDDGATWVSDNNYIGTGWGVEGTTYTITLNNLHLDTKNLDRHGRFKLRIGISTVDNKNGYEVTRSTTKWFVMSPYVINTSNGNLIFHSVSNGQVAIGENSVKNITDIDGMKVKVLDDGSEWARIFWHDVSTTATFFTDEDEASNCNLSNRFSKLTFINSYKYNDKYELMLCYPKYSTTKYNRWIQTANPLYTNSNATQTAATMGYQKIHIDFTTNWYYGMGLSSSSQAYMDCEAGHGNWFGGIGLYSAYNGGFPVPTESGMSNIQKEVELWIRIDRNVKLIDKNNTIYINTASEFYDFCDSVSNGNTYKGKTIMLMTNVTTSGASEHKDFYTAGDNDKPFEGTFDGNGHTLSILYVDNLFNQEYIGFIGHNKGVIKNLCVSSLYMNSARYGGLICGKNSGLIENCAAFGSMAWTHDTTLNITNGGITGFNSGTIRKCLVNGQINAPSQEGSSGEAGGIAGENEGDIISCRVAGMVSGYEAGGIVAYNYSIGSNIIRCINNATISSDSGYCGGIVGYAYRGTLRNCLNTGNGAVCGIIGLCENAWADNCYYASDYNSAGISFSGSGKTDTTIKKTLSSMKSQTMADLLGTNFFFYDRSSSQQFIKFGWEKVSGWSNGDGSGTDIFYYVDWAAPATKIQIVTYEDWESIGEQPTKFEFYFNNKLYTTILNPPRNINIDLYGSFNTSTSAPIETKWYGISGLKLNRENTLSYGVACFEKGTKVLTSNGLIPIENINEGDCVLSKNEQGFIEEQKVYHTYSHNPRSCL